MLMNAFSIDTFDAINWYKNCRICELDNISLHSSARTTSRSTSRFFGNNFNFINEMAQQPSLTFDVSSGKEISNSFKLIRKLKREKGRAYAKYAVEVLALALAATNDTRNHDGAQDELPGDDIIHDWRQCLKSDDFLHGGETFNRQPYQDMMYQWIRFQNPQDPQLWEGIFYDVFQSIAWMGILYEYHPNLNDNYTPTLSS